MPKVVWNCRSDAPSTMSGNDDQDDQHGHDAELPAVRAEERRAVGRRHPVDQAAGEADEHDLDDRKRPVSTAMMTSHGSAGRE